ncbi:MAG: A/G-specific adenine glycosylase, partial [Planctomycetes bacterium]|nr:A/G-specific adenine glycosylase [Planctomycetota bacterium]
MPTELAPAEIRVLQRELSAWFARERRDLPWRRTRDPYAIWISEAMLQQTRVETV